MMIDSFGDVPALVMGRFLDALGWNRAAHALLAGHLDASDPYRQERRPNVALLLFLDPHSRELYRDWDQKARSTVADLRLIAGRNPDDTALNALIGALIMHSPEFTTLWMAHGVGDCGTSTHTYRHPIVGTLPLAAELLALLNDDGQRVAVFTAEPGSASAAGLTRLTR